MTDRHKSRDGSDVNSLESWTNPFSPIFGGSPKAFFGRGEILSAFEEALEGPGNDYRALFITGVRALGKTALVERLSQIARDKGWEVLDLSSDHPIDSLVGRLAPYDEIARESVPTGSVGAFGLSASRGGVGTIETRHVGTDDLCDLFVRQAAAAERGILVTVDEIQKLALEDDERICSAFQMASRKGHNVALVVAGLPYARKEIVGHDGCTFMQRARWVELELLSHSEVLDAFTSLFGRIRNPAVSLGESALDAMVRKSKGQPYLMQLIGYELVRILKDDMMRVENEIPLELEVSADDVEIAVYRAMSVYERQVLDPLLSEARRTGRDFLQTMATSIDGNRRARIGIIAKAMGRAPTSLSSVRRRLIDRGIIVSPEDGIVRFNVPYLQEYLVSQERDDLAQRRLDEWSV